MSSAVSVSAVRTSPNDDRLTLSSWAGGLVAVIVGLLVGGLTAYAQGWLSDGLGSLANSAGPWSLAAFLVAMLTRRPAVAAVWAMVVLASCELGYVAATEIRGTSSAASTVVFWLMAAVVAGPPLGVGGAWTRRGDWWFGAGAGPAVLAGALVGEAIYGLTTVADTTTPAYWAAELAIGVAVVVLAGIRIVRRDLRPLAAIPLCVGSTALVAAVVASSARLA